MRIAHIATDHGPRPVVQHGNRWREVADPFAAELAYTGTDHPVGAVRLLAPVQPTVVVGMAHNGSPAERTRPPQAFLKSARTVTGPDTPSSWTTISVRCMSRPNSPSSSGAPAAT